MINSSFLKARVLLSWILFLNCLGSFAAFGQSEIPDTVKCYGRTELERIVMRVVRAKECDTLLIIANQEISSKDTEIEAKDSQIQDLTKLGAAKEQIISYKEEQLKTSDKNVGKLKRQKAILKVGWFATTLFLSITTLYFLIH